VVQKLAEILYGLGYNVGGWSDGTFEKLVISVRITACSASVRISLSELRGLPTPYGYDGHGNVRSLTNSGLRERVRNRKTSHQYLK
jgi:hypothetical protein